MSKAFPLIPSENRGVLRTCIWLFLERRACSTFSFPLPAAFKAMLTAHMHLITSPVFPLFCFHYSLFLFFLHSVCPTCCSASPPLRPSWCLWWTCLHPPNILHSPPSISCLLEPFSSSSSSFLDHQPLQCSLWNPRFVWSDLQSSSFRSEMRSLVWLHQTGWERWPGRREPLPVDKEKTSWKKQKNTLKWLQTADPVDNVFWHFYPFPWKENAFQGPLILSIHDTIHM